MNQANVEMLERAAVLLDPIPDEIVFLGGATIELWTTDPAPPEFRPTKDIDVIVGIATKAWARRRLVRYPSTGGRPSV